MLITYIQETATRYQDVVDAPNRTNYIANQVLNTPVDVILWSGGAQPYNTPWGKLRAVLGGVQAPDRLSEQEAN
jgi:hypothetical protein